MPFSVYVRAAALTVMTLAIGISIGLASRNFDASSVSDFSSKAMAFSTDDDHEDDEYEYEGYGSDNYRDDGYEDDADEREGYNSYSYESEMDEYDDDDGSEFEEDD